MAKPAEKIARGLLSIHFALGRIFMVQVNEDELCQTLRERRHTRDGQRKKQ